MCLLAPLRRGPTAPDVSVSGVDGSHPPGIQNGANDPERTSPRCGTVLIVSVSQGDGLRFRLRAQDPLLF